jgi:EAL domain-containing protein (putative c-di-GMP-specific phosphodiesterase class I)
VKIDGEFIPGAGDESCQPTCRSVGCRHRRGLGKRTIAEYVGDAETLALIQDYGVDYAQGFPVSKPRPLSEIDLARPGVFELVADS